MYFYNPVYNEAGHAYTFCVAGLRRRYSRRFLSRQLANEFMYKLCGKYDLTIAHAWEDNHDKTYKCSNGVTFYIQRV